MAVCCCFVCFINNLFEGGRDHISQSIAREYSSNRYQVTWDHAFTVLFSKIDSCHQAIIRLCIASFEFCNFDEELKIVNPNMNNSDIVQLPDHYQDSSLGSYA